MLPCNGYHINTYAKNDTAHQLTLKFNVSNNLHASRLRAVNKRVKNTLQKANVLLKCNESPYFNLLLFLFSTGSQTSIKPIMKMVITWMKMVRVC